MNHVTTESLAFPPAASRDALAAVLHEGARRMLADAIEAEVAAYIGERSHITDDAGLAFRRR